MTNFVQNIDAAEELCDELIAAGFTPFVSTQTDTFSALHEALDERAGVLIVPRDDNAIAIAAGVALAGGCPAVLLSDAGISGCADAIASLVTPHQTPLLLVIALGDDLPGSAAGPGPAPRRLAELLMAELGVRTVVVDEGARPSTAVRLAREIVREDLRPAALLVPLDAFGWPA
jgi:sulfopyruvate decarboxylase TPP-binding subunit